MTTRPLISWQRLSGSTIQTISDRSARLSALLAKTPEGEGEAGATPEKTGRLGGALEDGKRDLLLERDAELAVEGALLAIAQRVLDPALGSALSKCSSAEAVPVLT
jgi:hypothetical protein